MDLHTKTSKRRGTRDIACMRIDKVVGSGTFGVVYKAFDKQDKLEVALKKIKMERETQGFPVTAIREIKILNLMKQHINIVELRGVVSFNGVDNSEPTILDKEFNIGDVFMVFEFVDYDLSGLLKSSGLVLTEMHIRSFLKQLLSGVNFLHENKILHRDIKSANLLITKGNVLKIADWGLARSIDIRPDRKLTNPVVTLWYRSPELILGSRFYGSEVDVWSVGCIFGEMKTRMAMFRGESEVSQLDLIFQTVGSPIGEVLSQFKQLPDWEKINFNKTYSSRLNMKYPAPADRLFLALLEKLLEVNPATRITAAQALNDPYFTSSEVLEPVRLAPFNVEPVTEWMEQERQKKEYEERKQQQETRDKAKVEEQQRQQAVTQAAILESKAVMRQNVRQKDAAVNRFKIIKPGGAGAGAAAGNGGASSASASVNNGGKTVAMGSVNQDDPVNKKPRI